MERPPRFDWSRYIRNHASLQPDSGTRTSSIYSGLRDSNLLDLFQTPGLEPPRFSFNFLLTFMLRLDSSRYDEPFGARLRATRGGER